MAPWIVARVVLCQATLMNIHRYSELLSTFTHTRSQQRVFLFAIEQIIGLCGNFDDCNLIFCSLYNHSVVDKHTLLQWFYELNDQKYLATSVQHRIRKNVQNFISELENNKLL